MPDLGCSTNAAIAYDYLLGKGLRDFQAAAIVGNLQQESRLNTRAFFPAEASYGIAQWRLDRWQNFLAFASGRDPWALDTQLEFLWHELESRPEFGLAQIRASTTIEAATVAFQDRFERCGICVTPNRISYAQSALYACPAVRPPPPRQGGTLIATAGVLALVAAVGYGTYKILAARGPEPEIGPEPPPVFRPAYGTTWRP